MIIGISGRMQSGKDTAGAIIQKLAPEMDWKIKKFADPLKDVICILIGCNRAQLEDINFKNSWLGEEWDLNGKRYTVRRLLQEVGTDAIRNIIHPNAWINSLMTGYVPTEWEISDIDGKHCPVDFVNWIITDCRFPNEADSVTGREGIMIRINRGESTSTHESETALDNYKFKYVIDNNGTLEELVDKIREILENEGII